MRGGNTRHACAATNLESAHEDRVLVLPENLLETLQVPRSVGKRHARDQNKADRIFKHKYLTQPNMMDANALVQAADGLCGALQDTEPKSKAMKATVNALVKIFNSRAEMEKGPTD